MNENESLKQQVMDRLAATAGKAAIGLLSATVGFIGVLVISNNRSISNIDAQFASRWNAGLYERVIELSQYPRSHEEFRNEFIRRYTASQAKLEGKLEAQAGECAANWREVNARLRRLETLAEVDKSRMEVIERFMREHSR